MKRLLRTMKTLGKGLLAIAAVLALALLIARWVFVRQLDTETAAIKARGEPLTEAEMAGPPVPNAENAALVYEKAFLELPQDKVFWEQIEKIAELLRQGDATSLDKARRMSARYAKAVVLTKEATSMRRCRFTDDGKEFSNGPEARLHRLSWLLFHDAVLNARMGRMEEAVGSTVAMCRLPGALQDRYSLSSALTQQTLVVLACERLSLITQYGHMHERHTQRLYAELGALDLRSAHRQAILQERAHFLDISRAQQEDPVGWLRSEGVFVGKWDAVKLRMNPLTMVWRHVLLVGDQAAYLRFFEKLLKASGQSYVEAKALQHDAEWDIPFYAVITKMLAPVEARTLDPLFRAEAHIRGTQVFLALLTCRDRHGAYPSSLGELGKRLRWSIPKDPFSGDEFVYERRSSGFLLYSVGPDMKDNGGKPELKGKGRSERTGYDIPWETKN